MIKYKVITVYFPATNVGRNVSKKMWEKYKNAFVKSAKENLRKCEVEVVTCEIPPQRQHCKYAYTSNNLKLKLWVEYATKSDVPVVLMDIDMVILKDLWQPFKREFDIAVTKRPGKMWLNGGIMFVQPTEKARRDLKMWYEFDRDIYESQVHSKGDRRPAKLREIQKATDHDGMNQPTFVYLYENGKFESDIEIFPAKIYNNCDQCWHSFDNTVRVVHVKGKLREEFKKGFNMINAPYKYRNVINAIRKYYR